MKKSYSCTNTQQVQALLSQLIADAMKTTVAQTIKETEKKHIETDVFDEYDPKRYGRRSSGGIDDLNNIVDNVAITGAYGVTLVVKNTTIAYPDWTIYNKDGTIAAIVRSKYYGRLLAPLIEKGKGDHWDSKSFPRPFIANTKAEISKNHLIISSLKKYFEDMGVTVK